MRRIRVLGAGVVSTLLLTASLVAVGVVPAGGVQGQYHPRLQIDVVVNGDGTYPEGSLQVRRTCAPSGNATTGDSVLFTTSTVDLSISGTSSGYFLSLGAGSQPQSCWVTVLDSGGMTSSFGCSTANSAYISCSSGSSGNAVTWVSDAPVNTAVPDRTAKVTVTFDPPPTHGLVECEADPFGGIVGEDPSQQVTLPVGVVWCADLTVEKDVDGDDPGVEFPIDVTCETFGDLPFATQEILDPGDPGDDPESETVELGDGDDATFQIPVLTVWHSGQVVLGYVTRTVGCEVSEDPADAELPSGWVCDVDYDADDDVILGTVEDGEADQSATVVVVNDCEAPAEPEPEPAPAPAPTPAPAAAAAVVAQARFTG